ncbi:MAG: ROK family protein [bacterium]
MIDRQLPYFIGVDLGGTNIHAGIVDSKGAVLARKFVPTLVNEGEDRVVERLCHVIRELMERYPSADFKGIGIGAAGIIDISEGEIVSSPNFPGWRNVPIRDIISSRFCVPVILDNDANAAIFGEQWAGAGIGKRSLIGLTLGTGVGGGIILDGLLWHGSEGMAGEIGHMTIVPDGRRCSCGNRGCLESYASATAIVNRTIESMPRHPENNLLEMAEIENSSELTSEKIFQAALAGNKLAEEIFRETGTYLGLAIGSLINILNPEIFIIGGGASQAWDFFYPAMMDEIKLRALKEPAERIRVVPAKLGNDAGLIGACGLVLRSLGLAPS